MVSVMRGKRSIPGGLAWLNLVRESLDLVDKKITKSQLNEEGVFQAV